nr:unnamed protein product [Callosobruchus analis]CAI5849258.1 unnamed protein product [Callosobruchus analis]
MTYALSKLVLHQNIK